MSTTTQRLELLASWYVRVELLRAKEQTDIDYPIELNAVILDFLGNILLVLNIIEDKHRHFIKNGGRIIERGPRNGQPDTVQFVAASEASYDEGIDEFTVKCEESANDAIGICSDLNEVLSTTWCSYFETGYMYFGNGIILGENGTKYQDVSQWKKNDEITVRINCIEWKVTFFKNHEKVGESVEITPDRTYHPFIGCQNHDTKYEIV